MSVVYQQRRRMARGPTKKDDANQQMQIISCRFHANDFFLSYLFLIYAIESTSKYYSIACYIRVRFYNAIMKNILRIPAGLFMLAMSLNLQANPGDTLGLSIGSQPEFAPSGQVSLISLQGIPGYLYGTFWLPPATGINYTAIAQAYTTFVPGTITGIIVRAGAKRKGPNTATDPLITFGIHDHAPNSAYSITAGTLSETADIPGPSATLLGSETLAFSDLDTTGFEVIQVDPPVSFAGDIVISADFQAVRANGDTIGIISDQPGDGMGLNYSFHLLSAGTEEFWINTSSLAPNGIGNTNIAFFVILDAETSIEKAPFLQGLKAAAYPNPAESTSNITYSTEKQGKMSLELLSPDGKLISTQNLGHKAAGTYTTEINISGLAAGIYMYSVTHENGARYTQRLVIGH